MSRRWRSASGSRVTLLLPVCGRVWVMWSSSTRRRAEMGPVNRPTLQTGNSTNSRSARSSTPPMSMAVIGSRQRRRCEVPGAPGSRRTHWWGRLLDCWCVRLAGRQNLDEVIRTGRNVAVQRQVSRLRPTTLPIDGCWAVKVGYLTPEQRSPVAVYGRNQAQPARTPAQPWRHIRGCNDYAGTGRSRRRKGWWCAMSTLRRRGGARRRRGSHRPDQVEEHTGGRVRALRAGLRRHRGCRRPAMIRSHWSTASKKASGCPRPRSARGITTTLGLLLHIHKKDGPAVVLEPPGRAAFRAGGCDGR